MTEKEIEIIDKVHSYVKNQCVDIVAHDYYHIERVYKMALKISNTVESNRFVVSLTALIHDLFDPKFNKDLCVKDSIVNLLTELDVIEYINPKDLENICYSVEHLGFKGGFSNKELSIEGQIVQDADRLDAIGAIAIGRAFAYGGKLGRPLYDPIQGIVEITNDEDYRNLPRHTINHFYEKLLKLKDLMNTEEAKRMAISRHKFMEEFLDKFFDEWNSIS